MISGKRVNNVVRKYSILIPIVLFTSCNLTNQYVRKIDRYYDKLGTVEWVDETDSASIHWRKVGQGEKKLLLLHGFGPLTGLQWKDVVKELHHEFTMYIPDLIYFGESTSDLKAYDPGFQVRQLHQSMKKENLEQVYVAGLSYGGLISSIYAHVHADFVKGLVLIDALSKFLDDGDTDSLAIAYGYKNIQDILIPADGRALKDLFQISFYKPKKYPEWLLNGPAQKLYSNQMKEKRALLNYISENKEKVKQMNFAYNGNVQIIWGEEDLLIPVSNAYELEKFYPKSRLTILPEVGHVANMESPEEVAKIVHDFCLQ